MRTTADPPQRLPPRVPAPPPLPCPEEDAPPRPGRASQTGETMREPPRRPLALGSCLLLCVLLW